MDKLIEELKKFPTEQLVEELVSREKKEVINAVAELLLHLAKCGNTSAAKIIKAILSDD